MLGLGKIAKRLFGSANDRYVKTLQGQIQAINELEPGLLNLSDDEIKARTAAKLQAFQESLSAWMKPFIT